MNLTNLVNGKRVSVIPQNKRIQSLECIAKEGAHLHFERRDYKHIGGQLYTKGSWFTVEELRELIFVLNDIVENLDNFPKNEREQ